MATAGETIRNPVSGETITWLETTADTHGRLLRWEHALEPGARVPYDHVHPAQEERFRVLSGPVRFRVGRDMRDLRTGESLTVPVGIAHGFRNRTDHEVRVEIELRPPLGTEAFFERVFTLARSGQVNERGVPGPIRNAMLIDEHGDLAHLPGIPAWTQRLGVTVLARVGRLFGVELPPAP